MEFAVPNNPITSYCSDITGEQERNSWFLDVSLCFRLLAIMDSLAFAGSSRAGKLLFDIKELQPFIDTLQ